MNGENDMESFTLDEVAQLLSENVSFGPEYNPYLYLGNEEIDLNDCATQEEVLDKISQELIKWKNSHDH